MQKHHVDPRSADDSLSVSVYKTVIESLDPYGLVFLQSDIDSLSEYRFNIDDEIINGSDEFYLLFSSLFREASKEMISVLEGIEYSDINLSTQDTLYYSERSFPVFSSTEANRNRRYKRFIKNKILNGIFEKDSSADPIYHMSFTEANEICEKEFERVKMHEKRRLQYFENHSMGYENIMKLLYLNSISEYYDPHSMYFNPELNKWFQGKVGANTYSFGFTLEEDLNGRVKIASILPGGPAWRSNSIHIGDVLISGQWAGSEKQDFSLMSFDEVEMFLAESVNKVLSIEIRKADGKTISIDLKKEIVQEDEDIVHSYILQREHKVGLIILPSFYTDYDESANGCANDVAREIMKLKKEGIEGLILDLRFNGGGSIQEALDLAGIFIDAGPVCMVADNAEKPFSLKDRNRGTVWDGPLMIMVNAYSASASEIVSAALQDYNRALITGQKTYGKSTGQIVMPLDTNINADLSNLEINSKADAYIKLTNFKVYRISGQTHQKTGISPDIVFPDISEYETEKDEPHALPNIPVSKKSYYTPLPALPVDSIRKMYIDYQAAEQWFADLQELEDTLEILSDYDYRLFSFEAWQKFEYEIIKIQEHFEEKLGNFECDYTVANHSYDMDLLESDEFFRISNKASIDRLKSDHEMLDAMFIIDKLIELSK